VVWLGMWRGRGCELTREIMGERRGGIHVCLVDGWRWDDGGDGYVHIYALER
jgi:hypothetical protein